MFGPATTLSDIDAIAVATLLPDVKGTKKCSYTDDKDKASTIDMQLKETQVVVYARRNGTVIDKRMFAPSARCPMFVIHSRDDTSMSSDVPDDDVKAWLKSRLHV